MKICVLGSGSSGNCTYVGAESTHVLIDAGIPYKYTKERLVSIGADIDSVDGVLFTHEHIDHCRMAGAFHRRHGLQFYANEGTAASVEVKAECANISWNIFENGVPFVIDQMRVEAFSISHDSADPVGYVIESEEYRRFRINKFSD